MAWIPLAVAGVGALSSIIGNEQNRSSQQSANEANLEQQRLANDANLQIARETNDAEDRRFQENMSWLREQYYGDREWNDPRAMKERYIEAGINPLFAMGNSANAGASSSVGGSSLPNYQTPHMEAGHVQPTQYDYSGISESVGHAVDAYFNNEIKRKQAEQMGIDNKYREASIMIELNDRIAQTRVKLAEYEKLLSDKDLSIAQKEKIEAERDEARQRLHLLNVQFNDLSEQPKKQNALYDAQTHDYEESAKLKQAQQVLAMAQARYHIDENSRAWKRLAPEIANIISQTNSNNSQSMYISSKRLNELWESDDTHQMAVELLKQAKFTTDTQGWQAFLKTLFAGVGMAVPFMLMP